VALSKDYPKTRCLLPLPIEILPFFTEALEVVWILDRSQVNVFASDRVLSKYEQEASAGG
jgi:hypothetical protein